MITQELDLNMVPGSVPPVINVSQFDTGARTFVFHLYNGATLFNGAVASCRIEGIKPDNKGFSYNASYSNGVVTADCTEQMTAVIGNVLCEIRLLENSQKTLGTLNFILCVERSPLNESTDISQTELPAIIDLARSNAAAAANSASQAARSASSASTSASQAANIKTDLQNHLNQIDTNTANINGLRTDVNGLRTDVNKNKSDISGLRTDVNRNTTNISGLRTDVDKNTANIIGLRTDVDKNTTDLANLTDFVQKKNAKQDEQIKDLQNDLADETYRTDRLYENVFKDAEGRLYAKQGILRFFQGALIVKGKVPVITPQEVESLKEEKLNRPTINPAGDLNQLLASNGNGTNSNKWVNLEDLLRDSPLIKQLIDLITVANQGILTVSQGRLTFAQDHLKVYEIS